MSLGRCEIVLVGGFHNGFTWLSNLEILSWVLIFIWELFCKSG